MQKASDLTNPRSRRGRLADGRPNPIDLHIGNRIRQRRTLLGLSQEKLASPLGLTFQQVQKYERGMNRVGGSRLWDLSRVLNVQVNFFYEDMPPSIEEQSPRFLNIPAAALSENSPALTDPMQKEETIELVRNYYKIHNRRSAAMVFNLLSEMAKNNYCGDADNE